MRLFLEYSGISVSLPLVLKNPTNDLHPRRASCAPLLTAQLEDLAPRPILRCLCVFSMLTREGVGSLTSRVNPHLSPPSEPLSSVRPTSVGVLFPLGPSPPHWSRSPSFPI